LTSFDCLIAGGLGPAPARYSVVEQVLISVAIRATASELWNIVHLATFVPDTDRVKRRGFARLGIAALMHLPRLVASALSRACATADDRACWCDVCRSATHVANRYQPGASSRGSADHDGFAKKQ
jgi:hypothetical protein